MHSGTDLPSPGRMITLAVCAHHSSDQFALAAVALAAAPARAATLPTGFSEALVASGLESPTAMQFAPDGRLFVCEQGGRLRVIKNGALLPTPFLTLTVSSSGERGLLGVAFDPAFSSNQFIYLYYTATSPAVHNRISRFTANGDTVVPGSEVVILELNNLSSATNHNGGALAFGPDGKLYAAVGENANSANAQSMNNLLGKMLRINPERFDSLRQSLLHVGGRPESRDLGARASQPVYLRVQSGTARALHQRRRSEHVGRDQRRASGRQLRVADDRRADNGSPVRRTETRLQPQRQRIVRDHRRRVLFAARRAVSRRIRRRLLLRRLLRRVHPQARSAVRQHRHALRDGDLVSRRSEGRRRWEPLLSRAWIGIRRRGRLSSDVRRVGAQHHGCTPPAAPSNPAPR